MVKVRKRPATSQDVMASWPTPRSSALVLEIEAPGAFVEAVQLSPDALSGECVELLDALKDDGIRWTADPFVVVNIWATKGSVGGAVLYNALIEEASRLGAPVVSGSCAPGTRTTQDAAWAWRSRRLEEWGVVVMEGAEAHGDPGFGPVFVAFKPPQVSELWRVGDGGLFYALSSKVAERYGPSPQLYRPHDPLHLLTAKDWEEAASLLGVEDLDEKTDLIEELKRQSYDGVLVDVEEHPGGAYAEEVMLVDPLLVSAASVRKLKSKLLR